MQFQSDILRMKIDRPENIESTALGAGMLAGLGAGFWSDPSKLKSVRSSDKIFIPTIDDNTRTTLLRAWKKAVQKTQTT